ncbi:MAG TPA: hypothetical protein PLY85_09825, partial [Anaerolineaceae bacterium]|nr:hypothetical protein [Anaerolineaceae bacterium]
SNRNDHTNQRSNTNGNTVTGADKHSDANSDGIYDSYSNTLYPVTQAIKHEREYFLPYLAWLCKKLSRC